MSPAVTWHSLFVSPWIGGFDDEGAGWIAWVAGGVAAARGVAGYLRGERIDFGGRVQDDADERYRDRYR